jgi:hypothetical protein
MHRWQAWRYDGVKAAEQAKFAIIVLCRVAQQSSLYFHIVKTKAPNQSYNPDFRVSERWPHLCLAVKHEISCFS